MISLLPLTNSTLQDIKLSALKRVEQLNGMSEGDSVLVKFDLRGREYNGNYYVDLNAWRIESDGVAPVGSSSEKSGAQPAVDSAPFQTLSQWL